MKGEGKLPAEIAGFDLTDLPASFYAGLARELSAVGRTEASQLSSRAPTSDIPRLSVGRREREGPLGPTYVRGH